MVAEVCSFCGKRADEVRALVPGPLAVFICDVCVSLCEEINGKESARPQERANEAQVTEAELKERVRLRAAVAEFLKRYPQPELVLACSFGGKAKDDVRKLIAVARESSSATSACAAAPTCSRSKGSNRASTSRCVSHRRTALDSGLSLSADSRSAVCPRERSRSASVSQSESNATADAPFKWSVFQTTLSDTHTASIRCRL